jgi:hypothetical protein
LRKFSAWASSIDWNSILSSLETPSTSSAATLPKRSAISGLGDVGVLHHVVQQRRHQRLGVEVPAGEDFGHGERMGEVGSPLMRNWPLVRLGREDGRPRRRARCPQA